MPQEVNSAKLKTIVQKEGVPVLVLFYGNWCGDCRAFKPTWDRWCSGTKGPIFMMEIPRGGPEWAEWDLDEIPTVAVFRDRKERGRAHGTIGTEDLDRLWKIIC